MSDAAARLKARRAAKKPTAPKVVQPKVSNKLPHHEGCNCARCKKEKASATPTLNEPRCINCNQPDCEGGCKPDGETRNTKRDMGNGDVRESRRSVPVKGDRDSAVHNPAKHAQSKARKRATVKNHPRAKLPVHKDIPIYTPGKDVLFDGLVKVLSECRDCGETMQVIYATEYVHPCCTPKPTKVESLAAGWLTATLAGDDEAAGLTHEEIEKIDNQPPDLKAAALEYVSYGWPVFPLLPNSKEPATANGFKNATTHEGKIAKWWDRFPDSNIGLPTGVVFDALDVDPDKGGAVSFSNLLEQKRIPDVHGVVVTSGGGLHLYILARGKGNRAGWMPGLDYRGKGGYVVAPPSTLGTRGRAWSWLCVPSPELKGEKF